MPPSTQTLKQIHIKLTPDMHHALKLEAAYNDLTIQDLVVKLIEDQLNKSELSKAMKVKSE